MALLPESKSGGVFAEKIGNDVAPMGTWLATIIDIKDQFGVVRTKYDDPSQTEVVDLTTFLFGFRDQANVPHMMASRAMRISGSEKSTLVPFLRSILGASPKIGWDYCELKGKRCLITIAMVNKESGGSFLGIAALSPVPTGLGMGAGSVGAVEVVGPAAAQPPANGQNGQQASAPAAYVGAADEALPF